MQLLLDFAFESLRNGFKEVLGVEIHVRGDIRKTPVNRTGQVLRHLPRLDTLNARVFQGLGESFELGVVVQLGTVLETARPCKDRSDRIGRRLLSLLMKPETHDAHNLV